jgi:DNA-binding NarL/FixJ family response regulator
MRIVFVTHYDDISTIIRAFQMGAVSYFPKSGEINMLRSVIVAAAEGKTLLPPMVAGRITAFLKDLHHVPKPVSKQATIPLSRGEEQLLQLIASGLTNKDMASKLGTNEKTVKNRIAILFQKLSAKNRSHAVTQGFRFGILQSDAIE